MPELPEVETIKRELQKTLRNQIISGVEILWSKTVRPYSPTKFKGLIIGNKVLDLKRLGKMILIYLSKEKVLVIHLKMTGQLIFVPSKKNEQPKPGKHTRLIFTFKSGDKLYFNDLRKFGWIKILDKKLKKYLENELGIEPLSETFTMVNLKKILEKYPNRTVKQILLDQKSIAGIGNIYADESSFHSKILPMRKVKTLKPKEITDLHKNIITVLKLSISKNGTSSKDYLRSNGEKGGFVPFLTVYGRQNEKCKNCDALIVKIKHAGRGTHYCPSCQK